MLKCGVSPSLPGATERPSLGEDVLRPLAAPSVLLSPRLGDFRARQASATGGGDERLGGEEDMKKHYRTLLYAGPI